MTIFTKGNIVVNRSLLAKKGAYQHGYHGIGANMIDLNKYPQLKNNPTLLATLYQAIDHTISSVLKLDVEQNLPELNRQQTNSKLIANYEQTNSKLIANYEQTSSKTSSKQAAISFPFPSNQNYCHLNGHQKTVMQYCFDYMRKNSTILLTGISVKNLAIATGIKENVLNNALSRLIKKGLLIRRPGKEGRGGWLNFQLPEPVVDEMLRLNYEQETYRNYEQTSSKTSSNPPLVGVVDIKSPPSPPLKIDVSELKLPTGMPYGFHKGQLEQIAEKLTSRFNPVPSLEKVQLSIDDLRYDIDQNAIKIKTTGFNLWIAKVNEGTLYSSTRHASSAPIQLTHQQVTFHQEEKEKKQKEEQHTAQIEAENEKFEKWTETLTEEGKKTILKNKPAFLPEGIFLRAFYAQNIKDDFKLDS